MAGLSDSGRKKASPKTRKILKDLHFRSLPRAKGYGIPQAAKLTPEKGPGMRDSLGRTLRIVWHGLCNGGRSPLFMNGYLPQWVTNRKLPRLAALGWTYPHSLKSYQKASERQRSKPEGSRRNPFGMQESPSLCHPVNPSCLPTPSTRTPFT